MLVACGRFGYACCVDLMQGYHVSYMFRRSSYLPINNKPNKQDLGMLNVEGSDIADMGNSLPAAATAASSHSAHL